MPQPPTSNEPAQASELLDSRPGCLVAAADQAMARRVAALLDEIGIAALPCDPAAPPEYPESDCAIIDASLPANALQGISESLTPGSRLLLLGAGAQQRVDLAIACGHMTQALAETSDLDTLRHRLIALTQTDALHAMLGREKRKLRALATERDSLTHTVAFLEEKNLVLDKQRERLSAMIEKSNMITEISHKINSLDFDDIVKVCINKIPYVLGARWASLYLYDVETGHLVLKDLSHERDIASVVPVREQPNSLMAIALEKQWPLIVQDFESYRAKHADAIQSEYHSQYGTETCIVAPLTVGDQPIGVLNITEKKDGTVFDEVNDLPPIIQLSAQVAAAIHNYNLFQRVQTQARSDSMTGFLNHRAFYEELEVAIGARRRYGHAFSLVMIDIDKFKDVNDKHGHQLGDEVIRHVARVIRENVRDSDVPSRYGGDEFAIILKQADLAEAREVAERIRSSAVKASIRTPSGGSLSITLSVGIGEHDGVMTSAEFMRQTDQMMYRAKELGRNRVEEMAG